MSRVRQLNDVASYDGKAVVYVMARDQRTRANHALTLAQSIALKRQLPLAVVFCLHRITATVAREQYQFMLDGLRELEKELAAKQIPLMILIGSPHERLRWYIHHINPAAIVFDMSPLRGSMNLHCDIAASSPMPVYEVDTHNAVAVWDAYPKQAVGARVLRPHLHRLVPEQLGLVPQPPEPHPHHWPGRVMTMDELDDRINRLVVSLPENHTKPLVLPGERAAHLALDQFIEQRLSGYAANRNDPSRDALSSLSAYLHYGTLSSLQVLARVHELTGGQHQPDVDALFEEMIVRKDLSDNFCYYNPQYDSLDGAPAWARATLERHVFDPRQHLYSLEQLEQADTHDPAWNASQIELRRTGKIHGYMRMYWAKKVLEWSASPDEALHHLLYLNDFYHLDGRDPNGYVGIVWSIAGVHDRPWREREIFGSVRYMAASGLERKFAIHEYINQQNVSI